MKAPFEWVVAIRFLREGKTQTYLILAGIGVGVGVIVFLSALINGLQTSLIEKTLGTQPHVVVRPAEDAVRPIMESGQGGVVLRRLEQPAQRLRPILRWQQVLADVEAYPRVTAAAPVVSGAAFAFKGTADRAVALRGIEPSSYLRIIDLTTRMASGEFHLVGSEAVIGTELAKDFGVSVGDKIRITTATERSDVFQIAGIFDVGNKDLNERWVFVPLRSAQALLNLEGGVSAIELKVTEIFDAEEVAAGLSSRTGLVADSWMKVNTQLLTGLKSQNASSYMIQTFVVVAVALGISSVLVVSVVQKSREIGILKAMGTPTRRVLRIFLLEGAVLGLLGSGVGLLIGTGLALGFASLAKTADGSPVFPVDLNAFLYVRTAAMATLTGLGSAYFPARRAANLDPADVIRYG
jgi:lipoprotein-releasing system permease protein